jgi:hypothetical protein
MFFALVSLFFLSPDAGSGQLRQEHEAQVQRLIMKLTQEQLARTELEDRLEDTLVRKMFLFLLILFCSKDFGLNSHQMERRDEMVSFRKFLVVGKIQNRSYLVRPISGKRVAHLW